jgi:hypothetical protein
MENTIPNNLDEAIQFVLDSITKDDTNQEFLESHPDPEKFTAMLHMWFGRSLRNNWNLWWYENHDNSVWPKQKPEIVKYFNDIEIYHADDMSSIILTSVHRKYYNLPINLDNQIARYHQHWLESCGNINPTLQNK